MQRQPRVQLYVFVLTVAAILAAGWAAHFRAPFAIIAHADPNGIKVTGTGSCNAAACHGANRPMPPPIGHNESTIWDKFDLHSRAHTTKNNRTGLVNNLSKKIAQNLNIQNPEQSDRCLSCHALSGFSNGDSKGRTVLNIARDVVAADVANKKFQLKHGVSCDACHGPAESYLAPHVAAGWTDGQRKKLGSEKLYDQFGLYDTKNLKMRANMCVSCHLQIDTELLNASHPELPFELDTFQHGDWMHWKSEGNFTGVKMWAMGQFVSVREAALQLVERVKAGEKVNAGLKLDSYKQLVAHLLMARHPAKLIAPELEAELTKQLGAANDSYFADASKIEAALKAMGKAADALAEKLNGATINKEGAATLVNNVAAEGETAGMKGYRAAQQYSYAMGALWEANFLEGAAPIPDRRAMMEKTKDDAKTQAIVGIFEALLDPPNYKAETFVKPVKKLMAMFPGGTALPLPANAPDVPKPVAVAQEVPKPPVQPVQPVQPQPAGIKPQWIYCPECGRKWPYAFLYCAEDGHALPRIE